MTRGRAGRRGVWVALALGALTLLVGGLAAARLVHAFDARPSEEPAPIDTAYAIDGPLTCGSDLQEVPTLPLDAEPLAMLLCADPAGSQPWVAPADLVEGDLSGLRALLGDLEPTPDEPYDCTFQGGPAYDLFLRFSRDRYARIHGDTGGCGVVSTGIDEWFGADEVLDDALELVERQRDRRPEPTAVPAAPGCPDDSDRGRAYSLTGEVTELVVAVSCWRPDARKPRPFGEPVPVPARQLAVLLADVEQHSEPLDVPGDYRCPGGPEQLYSQVVVGRTAWGDLVAMSGMCREFSVDVWSQRPGDDAPRVWHPTGRSQRILDSLRR